jgi:hypothetical protein
MADVRLPAPTFGHSRPDLILRHLTRSDPSQWHCADNRRRLEEVLRFEVVHQVTHGHENAPNHLNRAP